MKTQYRVVTDTYAGFEVQVKRWWFPFWLQYGVNTHRSLDDAKAYVDSIKAGRVLNRFSRVVWNDDDDA